MFTSHGQYKEAQKNGVTILMHLRGRPRIGTPSPLKNASRQNVSIAYWGDTGLPSSGYLCHSIEHSKSDFRGLFCKCEINSLCIVVRDFSPDTAAKLEDIFQTANKKGGKNGIWWKKIKKRYARRRERGRWKRDDELRGVFSEKNEKKGQHLPLAT